MRHIGGGRDDRKPKKQETGEMSSMWCNGEDRTTCLNSKASFLRKHKNLLKHLNYKDSALKEQRYKLNIHQTRCSCRACGS